MVSHSSSLPLSQRAQTVFVTTALDQGPGRWVVLSRSHLEHLFENDQSDKRRSSKLRAMARGQQKIQSQQKNAKKAADKKKGQAADQKTAAKAALVHTCPVCRTQMPDPKTHKDSVETEARPQSEEMTLTLTSGAPCRRQRELRHSCACAV
uniref:Small EDRK-rich factor-like N-terminal domain-containing protein n=1 Tax=Knipowitschia caucasica TaxID=637954 RepID=A0AAV2K118_KNICA